MNRALARLAKELSRWPDSQHPFAPAMPKQLVTLLKLCQQQFSAAIPDGYLDLLAVVNGFTWNGLTVYAAEPRTLANERPVLLGGFIEENEGIRIERPEFADLFVFGHGDMDYFAYRIFDKKFLALGRGGEGVFQTYESFETMLATAIRRSLL